MTAVTGTVARTVSPRALIWLFHLGLPLVGLALLIYEPAFDVVWEDHLIHFELILVTALVNVGLAVAIGRAAGSPNDAPPPLGPPGFPAAAGFFAPPGLAPPAVVLSAPNA